MRRPPRLIALIPLLLALASHPALAETPGPNAQIEKLQDRVQALENETRVQKEISDNKLGMQDKRIEDMGKQTDRQANLIGMVGILTSVLGTLLTIFIAGVSIMGYTKAKRDAAEEARNAAEEWLKENERVLKAQIDALGDTVAEVTKFADAAQASVKKTHDEAVDDLNQTRERVKTAANAYLANAFPGADRAPAPDPKTVGTLQDANKALKQMPEAEFSPENYLIRGLALHSEDRLDAALDAFEQGLDLIRDTSANALRGFLLNMKGLTLINLQRYEGAIAAYDEVLRRFGQDDAPAQPVQVAWALVNKGVALGHLRQHDDAIAAFEEVLRRFGQDEGPTLRGPVAWAMVNKGAILSRQGQHTDAIAAYEEVLRRFGQDDAPELCEQVASALFNKGVTLSQQGQHEDAIAAYDEVLRRFGQNDTPALRERVAMALVNKSIALHQQGPHADAIAAYEEVVRRFGQDDAPALREQVAKAQNGIAFNQTLFAKQGWDDEDSRRHLLRTALERLDHALTGYKNKNKDRAVVLGNVGYAHFLLGEHAAAEAPTRACLQQGGEKQLEAQRGDARRYRVEPVDTEYEALLARLWAEVSSGGTPAAE